MNEVARDPQERLKLGLESVMGFPWTPGNAIERYRNGNEIFPAMLDAIASAEKRIEFLTFIYWTGRIAERFVDALIERAQAGVSVFVMLDGFGARPMPQALVKRLETSRVQVRWFRPLPHWKPWKIDNRTHRKLLICDGTVGFTGGVGIAEEWEGDARDSGEWRDSHYRIRGPAVLGLRAAFYEDWMESENSIAEALKSLEKPVLAGNLDMQVVSSGSASGWNPVARLQETLVLLATNRLRIQTAYFSPNADMVHRLVEAAGRGVDVEIMIPGPYVDKRISELAGSTGFSDLLEAGVRMWRYQPTLLHTKLITVDGRLACIGSPNFNQRSILKDNEIAVNILDADFVSRMDADFDSDRERCEPLDLESWENRGRWRRIKESFARIVHQQV